MENSNPEINYTPAIKEPDYRLALANLERDYIQKLLNLSQKCETGKDLEVAIACYRQIIKLQPQNENIHLKLALLLERQQEIGNAIEHYQRAIELNPQQPDWVYRSLGNHLYRQESSEAAIQAYQQAINLNPQQPDWLYRNLGQLWHRQQNWQQALKAYQQAVDLNPQQPHWVYGAIGDILYQQQQFDSAIAFYYRQLEISPHYLSEVHIKIGDIFNRQGKFFAAKAAYQRAKAERTTDNLNRVITFIRQYPERYCNKPHLDILDNGCEPSGTQLALLAEQTEGRVVGTNIYRGFPHQTVKRRRSNNEFYFMDGQNLTFEDNSFDVVMSLNVLEHVPNPTKYLAECFRVLRPGGYGYFSWYPIWSGATGHHMHPDMVSRASQRLGIEPPTNYKLDGSIIPLWGHLLLTFSEMLSLLIDEKKYAPSLAEFMAGYIYQHQDLNRWFWHHILERFNSLPWNLIEVNPQLVDIPETTLKQLQQKYGGIDDFKISGATIVTRKSP